MADIESIFDLFKSRRYAPTLTPPDYPRTAEGVPGSPDARLTEILSQLGTPAQIPVPEPMSGQEKAMKAILLALGAYVGAKGGAMPPAENPVMMDLLQRRREREAIIRQNEMAKGEAGKDKAKAELQILLDQRAARQRAAERKADREYEAGERAKEAQLQRDSEARLAKDSAELKKELQRMEAKTAKDIEKMRQDGKSDEDLVAKRQREKDQETSLRQAKAGILSVKANAAAQLQAKTPGQLTDEFIESMDVLGLEDEARKEALGYFHEKLGPAFDAWYAAHPPTTLEPTGSVLAPVKPIGTLPSLPKPRDRNRRAF
jgi:hypothetical protein